MGGLGSGVFSSDRDRKQTVDALLALDIRQLVREGHIVPGQEKFIVTEGVELALAWTPCNFGGARPWFLCPGERCGRRSAILYLGKGGSGRDLLCRHCHKLTYLSQYDKPLTRARRRANKLRARLGVAPDEELVSKPPRMHHRTFVRLGREYLEAHAQWQALYDASVAALAQRNSQLFEQMRREEEYWDKKTRLHSSN